MEIRPATLADASVLCAAEIAITATPGLLASRSHELMPQSFEARILAMRGSGCFVVAARSNHLLAHAVLEPMGLAAVAHVFRLTLVVHLEHTRQGIGSALLRHLQHWAQTNPSLHKIELNVRSTNTAAIALYERFGFTREGILRDRIRLPNGHFVDDFVMAWFP